MQLSKVYFHPRIDEHFGISIVEAMDAGLVPMYRFHLTIL
jgi:alpha-1,2-mannosyltransferase